MNNNILNYLPNLSFATTISVLIMFLKTVIDTFNMRAVEKIRFTNSQIMKIHFSQIVLLSLAFTIIFDATLIFENAFNWKNSNTLRIYLIGSFIFMLIITSIVYIIVYCYVRLISVKVNFFIIDDNEQKWSVIRRVDKNTILLEGERHNFKFENFNEINKREFFEELIPDSVGYNIRKYKKLLFVLLIIIVLLFILRCYSPAIILSYFFGVTIYLFFNNEKIKKKFSDGQQSTP